MSGSIIRVSEDFWNIRGSFRVARVIDLGTHASLVRRQSGGFLLLDSWTLTEPQRREVFALTEGGAAVEAILNLHPFHTLHCEAMHRDFPGAKLFGTARHHSKRPDLPWQVGRIEERSTQAQFTEDLDFSVPVGVHFIPKDEKLHFSSVLARHRASETLHVDDTLTFLRPPAPLRLLGMSDRVGFHPTLKKVLEHRPGAAVDFRIWAEALAATNARTRTLCAAHVSGPLVPQDGAPSIRDRILRALARVDPVLKAHEAEFG